MRGWPGIRSWPTPFLVFFLVIGLAIHLFWTKTQIVHRYADNSTHHRQIAEPLRRALPEADHPGNFGVFGQIAIGLGIGSIVQNIHDTGSTHARRIVDARVREIKVLAKLLHAVLG